MKAINLLFLVIIFISSILSCRKDFDFETATEEFRFSRDTVYLDTVFTTIRSETYSVKVYNQQNEDVLIPRIYLEEGADSYFRMNVDGQPGTDVQDVPLRANDSLYIFVEIAAEADIPNEALIEENLKIANSQSEQTVKLISLVEDAEFFFPAEGESEVVLSENTLWTSDKSKVIFGNLKVSDQAVLEIEEDTKIYFHKNSSLLIDSNSELIVNGSLGHEVVFRGDRHDARHDTLPANWEGVKLLPNAFAQIHYAKIKGGVSALEMYQAELDIKNTQIYNFVSVGILGIDAEIQASNLLINHCGEADVALLAGGNYEFYHCSFANYFDLGVGNAYSVYLSDSYQDASGNTLNASFDQALFANCLMYGDGFNSISTHQADSYTFDYCLIKYSNTTTFNPELDNRFSDCIFNLDPSFEDVRASVNNLIVSQDSSARNAGNSNYVNSHPLDYYGVNRASPPTIGAIE